MRLQNGNSLNAPSNFSWRGNRARRNFRPQNLISRQTSPLSAIHNRKVLVLADVENLVYSSRDLGYGVSFRRLTELLRTNSKSVSLHAFFSRQNATDNRIEHFQQCGWTVHTREIQTVQTHRGAERLANCDNLL
ncbi:MAG TPA: hypothetical protein VF692_14580, partial [Pyrinomonadaceae bacterium]